MTQISPDRIRAIEARRDELQALMSTGDLPSDRFVAVSKEYAELEPVAQAATEVRRLRQEAESLAFMADDADDELRAMASEELHENRGLLETALAPVATRRRCSRATCSGCTSAMPNRRAGGSR
jgi:peptide chain release factor 1